MIKDKVYTEVLPLGGGESEYFHTECHPLFLIVIKDKFLIDRKDVKEISCRCVYMKVYVYESPYVCMVESIWT